MKQVIVITGASSGFGRLSANALAKAGHIVYASMRGTTGRNAAQVADVEKYATDNKVDLRAIELDVGSQASADAAIAQIVAEQGRLDVVMHNAGHMLFGPAEAFTPEQLAELYDVNVLSTQRVNRAACRNCASRAGDCWSGSPAAARPAARLPISRRILPRRPAWMPWRWSMRANCRAGASKPRSSCPAPLPAAPIISRIRASLPIRPAVAEYEAGPYAGFGEEIMKAFGAIVPPDADASSVADAIVRVVDTPFGKRPFRVHIDPTQDGAEVAFAVIDRVRNEMLHRVGFSDLLHPRANG